MGEGNYFGGQPGTSSRRSGLQEARSWPAGCYFAFDRCLGASKSLPVLIKGINNAPAGSHEVILKDLEDILQDSSKVLISTLLLRHYHAPDNAINETTRLMNRYTCSCHEGLEVLDVNNIRRPQLYLSRAAYEPERDKLLVRLIVERLATFLARPAVAGLPSMEQHPAEVICRETVPSVSPGYTPYIGPVPSTHLTLPLHPLPPDIDPAPSTLLTSALYPLHTS
ncbi:hypothetical protein J6590_060447 [Homalodisca vitripennis]|nr:hypothetical protein J6590_060447 [Homalodisca vitripennis]